MKLIDADILKSHIEEVIKKQNGGDIDLVPVGDLLTFIGREPTAYDVDAVVEQLEKKIQTHERCIEYEKKNGTITEEFQQRKAIEVLKDAIEIVKGGGVDA